MRILVLGGTQFVGRHIVEAALSRGHEITVANRGRSNPGLFPDVEERVIDRTAGELASLSTGAWDALVDVNAYLPRIVGESAALLAERVGHCTFVSTTSTYGPRPVVGADETAETPRLADPTAEEITADTYGRLKVHCEEAARAAWPGRTMVVRPGAIVGPHDVQDLFPTWVRAMRGPGPATCGARPDQPVQAVDARDLAAFVVRHVEAGTDGLANVVGPATPITMRDLLASLGPAPVEWGGPATGHFVLPHDRSADGGLSISNARALSMGLELRPLSQSAHDVRAQLDA